MLKWLRKYIRNYFGFSKTETNGLIILIPLMVIFLFAPTLYTRLFSIKYENYEVDKKLLDSIMTAWNENVTFKSISNGTKLDVEGPAIVLQAFDPNSAPKELLISVGIPSFLAQRILNYRSQGGRFRIKADLGKIYDFPDALFMKLKPYVLLPDTRAATGDTRLEVDRRVKEIADTRPKEEKPEKIELESFDINKADTTRFKSLRGIGTAYANRIVKYRKILGGFASVDQMAEVYGVSDSLLSTFRTQLYISTDFEPDKINLNLATFKELNAHPYITYQQAGEILNAKSKMGKFKHPTDLKRVASFSAVDIKRLTPYISFR